MLTLISRCKPGFLGMSIWAFIMTIPLDQVSAAIVGSELRLHEHDGQIRSRLLAFLARDEVRGLLLQHGIDPSEAEARIKALTDEEVLLIAAKADHLVAAGRKDSDAQIAWYYDPNFYLLALMLGILTIGLIVKLSIKLIDWAKSMSHHRDSPPKIQPSPATGTPDQVPPLTGQGNK